MKPSLLIAASTESLYLAYEVRSALEKSLEIRIWGENIFNANSNFMESLLDDLQAYDYGLMILSQIDTEKIRNK